MSENLTSLSAFPEELKKDMKRMECRLLHSTVPKMTGKIIWNQERKEYMREIILVCKEGCKYA